LQQKEVLRFRVVDQEKLKSVVQLFWLVHPLAIVRVKIFYWGRISQCYG
jgi:hypothetical protein